MASASSIRSNPSARPTTVPRKGRRQPGGDEQVSDPEDPGVARARQIDHRGVVEDRERAPGAHEVPVPGELHRVVAQHISDAEQRAATHREPGPILGRLGEQVSLLVVGGWRGPRQIGGVADRRDGRWRREERLEVDVGVGERLRDQVPLLVALEPGGDRLAVLGLRIHGGGAQVEHEHGGERRGSPAHLVGCRERHHGRCDQHRHREWGEPQRIPPGGERQEQPECGAGADPPGGAPPRHRIVPQPLDTGGGQDRDGHDRDVPHAAGIVEVDVAEGHPQQQRTHPARADTASSIMNQVRASAPPKATTRPRRALARRASGTARSTAAPA